MRWRRRRRRCGDPSRGRWRRCGRRRRLRRSGPRARRTVRGSQRCWPSWVERAERCSGTASAARGDDTLRESSGIRRGGCWARWMTAATAAVLIAILLVGLHWVCWEGGLLSGGSAQPGVLLSGGSALQVGLLGSGSAGKSANHMGFRGIETRRGVEPPCGEPQSAIVRAKNMKYAGGVERCIGRHGTAIKYGTSLDVAVEDHNSRVDVDSLSVHIKQGVDRATRPYTVQRVEATPE